MFSISECVSPKLRDIRLATDSYSRTSGTDKKNVNLLLSINDKSLNDAPFLERKADITTQVSMTINDFILVLYAIPN